MFIYNRIIITDICSLPLQKLMLVRIYTKEHAEEIYRKKNIQKTN